MTSRSDASLPPPCSHGLAALLQPLASRLPPNKAIESYRCSSMLRGHTSFSIPPSIHLTAAAAAAPVAAPNCWPRSQPRTRAAAAAYWLLPTPPPPLSQPPPQPSRQNWCCRHRPFDGLPPKPMLLPPPTPRHCCRRRHHLTAAAAASRAASSGRRHCGCRLTAASRFAGQQRETALPPLRNAAAPSRLTPPPCHASLSATF